MKCFGALSRLSRLPGDSLCCSISPQSRHIIRNLCYHRYMKHVSIFDCTETFYRQQSLTDKNSYKNAFFCLFGKHIFRYFVNNMQYWKSMVKKTTISHSMLYCPISEGSLQKAHLIFSFTEPVGMDENHELKLSRFTKFSASLPVVSFLDFIHIDYKVLVVCALFSFLFLLSLFVTAQEATDSVYAFRCVSQKDMFFVPYGKNRAELERLSRTIGRYHREIADGVLPLRVDGCCNSLPMKRRTWLWQDCAPTV